MVRIASIRSRRGCRVKPATRYSRVTSGEVHTIERAAQILTLPSPPLSSHTPPIGGTTTSATLQPSLHISDLTRQASTGYFYPASPAPFQSSTLIENRAIAPNQSSIQQYSSSIPIATASPRRKAFQSNEGQAHSADRPSSYLPVPRGLTPLSMTFVGAKHSTSSASISSRPGFPSVPSSDLLHTSQRGIEREGSECHEIVSSPFQTVVYHEGYSPHHQSSDHHHHHSQPSSATLSHSPSSGTWSHSSSSRSPQSTKLNFSYPTPVMQAPPTSHVHSRSAEHTKGDSSNNVLRHLRNRSNGTVITYASSAFSNHSDATARIQPVIFNDSPRSSVSADLYQPSTPYTAGSTFNKIQHTSRPRRSSTSKLQSTSSTMYNYESSPEMPQTYSERSPGSMAENYRFPSSSSTPQFSRDADADAPLPAPAVPLENNRRSKRRASGKLPDMLFSRTPSHEEGPAEPISPISIEGDEDIATVEDESVLDPMDDVQQRQSQHLYADLRLSSTSSLEAGDETLKQERTVRPPLGQGKESVTSLMTSTSSTATSTSWYGMAV